jgi:hypothetical protein
MRCFFFHLSSLGLLDVDGAHRTFPATPDLRPGFLQVCEHFAGRPCLVPLADCLENAPMCKARPVSALYAGRGYAVSFDESVMNDGQYSTQDWIVGRFGHGFVEGAVDLKVGFPLIDHLCHADYRLFEALEVACSSTLRRQSSHRRFDDPARFEERSYRRTVCRKIEAEGIIRSTRLEANEGAYPGLYLQHIHGLQKLNGLAKGGTAHLEQLHQFRLAGNPMSRAQIALGNHFFQTFRYVFVQLLPNREAHEKTPKHLLI